MKSKIVLKSISECTGCGACLAACPHSAIKQKNTLYTWTPNIDATICKSCGLCSNICSTPRTISHIKKRAYIAYNSDADMRFKSASGGVFSALATHILQKNGIVYGACLSFNNGVATVEHQRVTSIVELPTIMGSKYVQSDCSTAYREVKRDLNDGKIVLFSGCSCQITGLKNYLRNTDTSNLYTMDLICHGVPTIHFFNKYISWLQNKYHSKVINFTFRTKTNEKILYEITVEFDNKKRIVIPIRDSGYYRMFIGEENYRDACYNCEYASLDKPADITTGDYFEATKDYPELFVGENAIDRSSGISCMITHTNKGNSLIQELDGDLFLHEVDPKVVQNSHGNLCRPSKHSFIRNGLKISCSIFGYRSIETFYRMRNRVVDIIKRK